MNPKIDYCGVLNLLQQLVAAGASTNAPHLHPKNTKCTPP